MKVQLVRSACVIITYCGKRILVDPWLAEKNTDIALEISKTPKLKMPLVDLAMKIEDIVNVDCVIITHLHFDHFGESSAKLIPKNLPVYSQDEEDCAKIKNMGFADVRVLKDEGSDLFGFKIFRTSCNHGPREEFDSTKPDASGFVLSSTAEKTIYLAGDTIYYEGVEETMKKFKPSVVITNSCRAVLYSNRRIIMGNEDNEELHKKFPDAKIVCVHMDNVTHATLTRKDVRDFITKNNYQDSIFLPDDGQTLEF